MCCWRTTRATVLCFALTSFWLAANGFDTIQHGDLLIDTELNVRLGLQYGEGINFGLGALDDIGETERATLYASIKPKLDLLWQHNASETYAGVSAVLATTTLDGEISGQIARSGDDAFDTDHAFIGWRNDFVDISGGGQEYAVGDGFIIGDGNFNTGGEDGQYWSGSFLAWRNSAIVKINSQPLRAEMFWLRTDRDLGDSRVVGINIENSIHNEWGTVGFMYLEVLAGDVFNLDGIEAWNIRGHHVRIPGIENLQLFGEWVLERGTDDDSFGQDNDAVGWYIEGEYTLATIPWTPKLSYRYIRLSGDEAGTPENEEYRGLFYTIFKRDWDTWYQGEIAGEYHLFNQNQITHMFKVKAYPREKWALTFYFYSHDLEEPHYFATPVSSTDWSDEINLGVEHFIGSRFYGYAGVAWGTPNSAAGEIFGNDNFTVVQTWLSVTF